MADKPESQGRYIIRVSNTDLDGKKSIAYALRKIMGVNTALGHALCTVAGIDPRKKAGMVTEKEEAQLNELLKNPKKAGIPDWMLNRQKDRESGEDMHLIGPDVNYVSENDVKNERKLKTYKGQRHALRLPVRGQRTQSNFRKHRKKQVSRKARGE